MKFFAAILDYFNLNNRSIAGSKYRHDFDCRNMNRFSPTLRKWVDSKREDDRKLKERMLFESELIENDSRKSREHMMKSLRKARKSDYDDWLSKYINAGGKSSHWYDYPWSRWDSWYVAIEDIVMYPLYGAQSIHIIVPHGIHTIGDRGHSELYRYDDIGRKPGKYDCRFVPVFCDSEA